MLFKMQQNRYIQYPKCIIFPMMKINFDPDIYLFIENLFFLALKIGLKSKCVLCQEEQGCCYCLVRLCPMVTTTCPRTTSGQTLLRLPYTRLHFDTVHKWAPSQEAYWFPNFFSFSCSSSSSLILRIKQSYLPVSHQIITSKFIFFPKHFNIIYNMFNSHTIFKTEREGGFKH